MFGVSLVSKQGIVRRLLKARVIAMSTPLGKMDVYFENRVK